MKAKAVQHGLLILTIMASVVFVGGLVYKNGCTPRGMYKVEGWSHGFAMCEGKQEPDQELRNEDAFSTWAKDGIFYMINAGHLEDPEVKVLVQTAERECQQYFNK